MIRTWLRKIHVWYKAEIPVAPALHEIYPELVRWQKGDVLVALWRMDGGFERGAERIFEAVTDDSIILRNAAGRLEEQKANLYYDSGSYTATVNFTAWLNNRDDEQRRIKAKIADNVYGAFVADMQRAYAELQKPKQMSLLSA